MAAIVQKSPVANLNQIAQQVQQTASITSQSLAQTSRAQGQATQDLASRLAQFSGQILQRGNMIMEKEAKERAIIDVNNGVYDNENKDTLYGMAYANSADTAYASKVATDAKGIASQVKAQNLYNPDGFANAYSSYAKTTINKAPTPALKAVAERTFATYGTSAYSSLVEDKAKATRANEINSYKGYQSALSDEYKVAVANKDVARQQDILDNLTQLQSSAVYSLFTSQGEVTAHNRTLVSEAYRDSVLTDFGDTFAEYKAFKDATHPLITVEEKANIEAKMVQRINTSVSLYEQQEKRIDDNLNKIQEKTEKSFYSTWVAGGLNQNDLDRALQNEQLTPSSYDRLSKLVANPGLQYDDTNVLLRYETNLSATTEDEIMEAPLTNTTKTRLINERTKFIQSEDGRWASSIQGREAISRVNRKFNVIKGGITNFAGSALKDYDKVYRVFYDSVMALPIEQRQSKSLELADAAINNYDLEKSERRQARKQQKDDKLKAEKLQEDNSTINQFYNSTKTYVEDMFTLDVEVE